MRTLTTCRSTDAMDPGLHRIEDDLADDALETWIERVLAELEAYLAYVAGSES